MKRLVGETTCRRNNRFPEEEDSKTLVHDKHDGPVTCVLCCDLHLTVMFSSLLQKDLF